MAGRDIDGVRIYRYEEIEALIDAAIKLGLEGEIPGDMTIGELDTIVNGDAN